MGKVLDITEFCKNLAQYHHQSISWETLRSMASVFDLVDQLPSHPSLQDTVEIRHVCVTYDDNLVHSEAIVTAHLNTPLQFTLNANMAEFTSMKLIINAQSGITIQFLGSYKLAHSLIVIRLESLPDQSGFIVY